MRGRARSKSPEPDSGGSSKAPASVSNAEASGAFQITRLEHRSPTTTDLIQLQQTAGNAALARLLVEQKPPALSTGSASANTSMSPLQLAGSRKRPRNQPLEPEESDDDDMEVESEDLNPAVLDPPVMDEHGNYVPYPGFTRGPLTELLLSPTLEPEIDPPDDEITPARSSKRSRKDRGDMESHATFKPKGKGQQMGKRSVDAGSVKRTRETTKHVSLGTTHRTTEVSGFIDPQSTRERRSAPDTSAEIRTSTAGAAKTAKNRDTGITGAHKGHLMALELGGPDIPENIVPQWGNFQANGVWREAEKAALVKANALDEGHRLRFTANAFYKKYQHPEQATRRGLTVPIGFKITVVEVDGDDKEIGSEELFNGEQEWNETDWKQWGNKLDEIEENEAEFESGDDSGLESEPDLDEDPDSDFLPP